MIDEHVRNTCVANAQKEREMQRGQETEIDKHICTEMYSIIKFYFSFLNILNNSVPLFVKTGRGQWGRQTVWRTVRLGSLFVVEYFRTLVDTLGVADSFEIDCAQNVSSNPLWAWWHSICKSKWRPHAKMRLVGRRQAENNLCNSKKNMHSGRL